MDRDIFEHSPIFHGHFNAARDDLGLLSNSPLSVLIPENYSYSAIQDIPALALGPDSKISPYARSEADLQAGAVVAKIEDILEEMVDCISGEKKELVIHLKSRPKHRSQRINSVHQVLKDSTNTQARAVRFPGRTAQEAWKFTVLLRILGLIHDSLITGIVTTKRDIYYRDPELFAKQLVVDRYVDDIAYTLGVKRQALNVGAAAKGLVAGALLIFKKDGTGIDCRVEKNGVLIPNVEEILMLGYQRVNGMHPKWMLVVEKEATFHSLVANRYWDCPSKGRGILITGKGYPDVMTRAFARTISIHIPNISVLGLVDFDPYGVDILCTYKYGSISLAHETGMELATLVWFGLKSHVFQPGFLEGDLEERLLKLTARDRRKAISMLNWPLFQEEAIEENDIYECKWRRELQVMLILNLKAEIQVLGNSVKLVESLSKLHNVLM